MTTVLTADVLLTPLQRIERPVAIITDAIIDKLGSQAEIAQPRGAKIHEFKGGILAPGMIDVHIHGGAGGDVMETGTLPQIERFLARHGVTSYLPTTVTAPLDHTLAAVARIGAAIEADKMEHAHDRARPLGIHLEGPFISDARRGVHPADFLLPPSRETFDRLWQAAGGHVAMITIAPELDGALDLIRHAAGRGACVSIGHSDADLATAEAAVLAGARHATHTFNAMRPLDHRSPSILAAALTDPRICADLICDGVHVDPVMVDLFLRAKGPDNAILISDALSPTGMPPGRYQLGGMVVEVAGNVCMHGGTLAGSVLTLDRAVRNAMKFARWDLQSALRLATINPARQLRLLRESGTNSASAALGVLAPGSRADIVALSPAGDVLATFIGGELV